MQETQIQSLGQEDRLDKEWLPITVFFPGKSHGQWSLVGYSIWGRKELDPTWGLNNDSNVSIFSSNPQLRFLTKKFICGMNISLGVNPQIT